MAHHMDLEVWKRAVELAKSVYELTAGFPASEIYGLSSQMRRAAVSIPSNIAGGAARNGDKEFLHFLNIALGSAAELDTQYILSKELQLTVGSARVESGIEEAKNAVRPHEAPEKEAVSSEEGRRSLPAWRQAGIKM